MPGAQIWQTLREAKCCPKRQRLIKTSWEKGRSCFHVLKYWLCYIHFLEWIQNLASTPGRASGYPEIRAGSLPAGWDIYTLHGWTESVASYAQWPVWCPGIFSSFSWGWSINKHHSELPLHFVTCLHNILAWQHTMDIDSKRIHIVQLKLKKNSWAIAQNKKN